MARPGDHRGLFLALLGWTLLAGTTRTVERLPGLLAAASGGLSVAIVGAIGGATPFALPLLYAVAGFVALFAHASWYYGSESDAPRDVD